MPSVVRSGLFLPMESQRIGASIRVLLAYSPKIGEYDLSIGSRAIAATAHRLAVMAEKPGEACLRGAMLVFYDHFVSLGTFHYRVCTEYLVVDGR